MDMKGTWKILKQAMDKEAKQTDIDKILVDEEEITDKQEISEWFNEHFVTIGEKLAKGIANRPSLHRSVFQMSAKMTINLNLIC